MAVRAACFANFVRYVPRAVVGNGSRPATQKAEGRTSSPTQCFDARLAACPAAAFSCVISRSHLPRFTPRVGITSAAMLSSGTRCMALNNGSTRARIAALEFDDR